MTLSTIGAGDNVGRGGSMDNVYGRWVNRLRGKAGARAVVVAVALVVIGGNLAIVTGLEAAVADGGPARPIWPVGVALLTVAVAALRWRRAHPIPVLVVTAA